MATYSGQTNSSTVYPEGQQSHPENILPTDTVGYAVYSAPVPISPLYKFLARLLIPQEIKHSNWLSTLELDCRNVKLFLMDDAEHELMLLLIDISHRSFLQFCVYLLHDRIVEYTQLKRFFQFRVCPIMITLPAVQTAMQKYFPLFEYKPAHEMHPMFVGNSSFRRVNRLKYPMYEVIYKNSNNYDWNSRNETDIAALNRFLQAVLSHSEYAYNAGRSNDVTVESLTELRNDLFERRYYAYLMTPFEIPPVSLVTPYIPLCAFKSVPQGRMPTLTELVRPYSVTNEITSASPSSTSASSSFSVGSSNVPVTQGNPFIQGNVNSPLNQPAVATTSRISSQSQGFNQVSTSRMPLTTTTVSPSMYMIFPAENVMPQLRVLENK